MPGLPSKWLFGTQGSLPEMDVVAPKLESGMSSLYHPIRRSYEDPLTQIPFTKLGTPLGCFMSNRYHLSNSYHASPLLLRSRGFTVIELMVTLTVGVVLAGVAIPSFMRMIAQNQLATTANDFLTAFVLARHTAIAKGISVTLCAGDATTGCHSAANWDWAQGWLVFVDQDRDGRWDADESIVHQSSPSPTGLVITGNRPMRKPIIFSPLGAASQPSGAFSAGTLRVCTPSRIQNNARDLILSKSGRIRAAAVDLTGACVAP